VTCGFCKAQGEAFQNGGEAATPIILKSTGIGSSFNGFSSVGNFSGLGGPLPILRFSRDGG